MVLRRQWKGAISWSSLETTINSKMFTDKTQQGMELNASYVCCKLSYLSASFQITNNSTLECDAHSYRYILLGSKNNHGFYISKAFRSDHVLSNASC